MTPEFQPPPTTAERVRAYAVHVLTASGIIFVFLAATEVAAIQPNTGLLFFWLAMALVVDAVDGPLARRWRVGQLATRLDGRTLDDIVDYLSFSFIPLLLIWKMQWAGDWSTPLAVGAMLVSLLGFANIHAKQDAAGFFSGFPSYWNLTAYFAGLFHETYGSDIVVIMMLVFMALTLLPVRFIYPNKIRAPFRMPLIAGGGIWLLFLLATLPAYPDLPGWAVWIALSYPIAYLALSAVLDVWDRLVGEPPGR
ncbi:MAG: phosphatidylcholine synthase [Salinisphaeraceae bacterium]|nr:phosphatidylcholine synthase [Salinisphaeraceae bacterium]